MRKLPIILLASLAFGYLAGTSMGDGIAEGAERAHNATVIATVEIASHRYSRYPSGTERDFYLYPELNTPRIPMSQLDDEYR